MTSVLLVILLLVAGLSLIAIEVLIIPGVGLVGVLGAAAVLGGGYIAFGVLGGGLGAGAFAGGVVVGGLAFWLMPRTGLGRAMVLTSQTVGTSAKPGLHLLVGRRGRSLTPLRPSGAVEIDGESVDVVTDGQYVEAGRVVQVVRVEGARVVVELVEPTATPPVAPR